MKRLLSQNFVYQQLPNMLSLDAIRTRLPQITPRQQINLLGIIKGVIGSDIFSLNLPSTN
jgi:hypothetical protein